MTFKSGDRVRYTGKMNWKNDWQDCTVIKQEISATTIQSLSLKEQGRISVGSVNTCDLELISPPFQLEVGKTYVDKDCNKFKTDSLLMILIDKHGCKRYCYLNGKAENGSQPTLVAEYTPPPPEEWRALYYRPNSRPEVSAAYWDSESKCKEYHDDDDLPLGERNFMYAIRTDVNAKGTN